MEGCRGGSRNYGGDAGAAPIIMEGVQGVDPEIMEGVTGADPKITWVQKQKLWRGDPKIMAGGCRGQIQKLWRDAGADPEIMEG